MIIDVVRTASFIEIKRTRRLPYPGQVVANEGIVVKPENTIAEASLPGGVMMLDIARGLGIDPDEAFDCLICDVGDFLSKGDVIAQYEKTLPRLFRAPIDGKVINFYKGLLALATKTSDVSIQAEMLGVIEEVIPEYGVVITARGCLIQGLWGNKKASSGVLMVLDTPLDRPLESSSLNDVEAGQIVAGGICSDVRILDYFQEKKIAGLVLGVLTPELVPKADQLPFPLIVLNGFEVREPSQDIFDLLKKNNGQTACLNTCKVNKFTGERPELFIPKEDGDLEKEIGFRKKLEIGDQVRLLSGKALYQSGQVVELAEEAQIGENCGALPIAVVKLKSLEKVRIPQQNLLIIG